MIPLDANRKRSEAIRAMFERVGGSARARKKRSAGRVPLPSLEAIGVPPQFHRVQSARAPLRANVGGKQPPDLASRKELVRWPASRARSRTRREPSKTRNSASYLTKRRREHLRQSDELESVQRSGIESRRGSSGLTIGSIRAEPRSRAAWPRGGCCQPNSCLRDRRTRTACPPSRATRAHPCRPTPNRRSRP